jgi:hypothetical protein
LYWPWAVEVEKETDVMDTPKSSAESSFAVTSKETGEKTVKTRDVNAAYYLNPFDD